MTTPGPFQTELTRRRFLAASSLSLLATTLAACNLSAESSATASSSGSSPSAPDGLRLLRFSSDESTPSATEFYRRAVAAYRETNPDIDVDIVLISEDARLPRSLAAFASGADLGIFAPDPALSAEWARAGYLLPLDTMIQEIGEADFLPGSRLIIDGSDYGMPYQSNVYCLWVRDDLLDAQGLRAPTTYEELIETARALNRDGVAGISLPVGSASGLTANFFAPFIYQSGWDYFDKQGNLTFDQPDVLDAVQRYVDLMALTPPALQGNAGYFDVIDAYVTGRAAMVVYPGRIGVDLATKAPEIAAKTSVYPLPAGPVLTGQALGGVRKEYVIHSKTTYPEQSVDFLRFITTGQQGLDFAMTAPGQLLPQLESVLELVPSYDSEFMNSNRDWVETQASLLPAAMNPTRDMGSVNSGVLKKERNFMPWAGEALAGNPVDGTMFQRILLNGEDVDSAWAWASGELKRISDAWKSANPGWKPTVG